MDDENERVRRTLHLLLDMAAIGDQAGPTSTMEEMLVEPLWAIPAIEIDPEEESVDPMVLMQAVDYLVSALLEVHARNTNQDELDVIASFREHVDRDWGPAPA